MTHIVVPSAEAVKHLGEFAYLRGKLCHIARKQTGEIVLQFGRYNCSAVDFAILIPKTLKASLKAGRVSETGDWFLVNGTITLRDKVPTIIASTDMLFMGSEISR